MTEIQSFDWPHDTHLMQHGNYRGVTDEIAVLGDLILLNLQKALHKKDNFSIVIIHIIGREVLMNYNVLRSFASQFAQGIIYVMNSQGTEDAMK